MTRHPTMLFDPALQAEIMVDQRVRQEIARQSHLCFFSIYLPHYLEYAMAPFQHEMFRITEDERIQNAIIMAFRNSAKSTIVTLSYALWSILGHQQKKFVVIFSHTQAQAQQHLKNIKTELETNEMLRADLGPFKEDVLWGQQGLVIPKYNARIIAVSTEQSIRGARHLNYRPDLIICDDIENREQMKTLEGRNKMEDWFMGEVIPLGDIKTRMMMVGNLTHEDSLLMRLIQKAETGEYLATILKCPLLDAEGVSAWPGKFPDQTAVEEYRRRIGISENAWRREIMLEIIPDEDQVIRQDWISYYDTIPSFSDETYAFSAIGADPAISRKDSADKTALVVAHVFIDDGKLQIYIEPYPVNAKLTFKEILDEITQKVVSVCEETGNEPCVFVEANGYQQVVQQALEDLGYDVKGIISKGDKRSRLASTTDLIQNQRILFPKKGASELIVQLVYFGQERYDDLVDAFSILINEIRKSVHRTETIGIISVAPNGDIDDCLFDV